MDRTENPVSPAPPRGDEEIRAHERAVIAAAEATRLAGSGFASGELARDVERSAF